MHQLDNIIYTGTTFDFDGRNDISERIVHRAGNKKKKKKTTHHSKTITLFATIRIYMKQNTLYSLKYEITVCGLRLVEVHNGSERLNFIIILMNFSVLLDYVSTSLTDEQIA